MASAKISRPKAPTSYAKDPYRDDLVKKVVKSKALTDHYAKKGTKKK